MAAKNPECCICGKTCETRWGNDAWPVKDDGVCCDDCNWTVVLPARILELAKRKETAHKME